MRYEQLLHVERVVASYLYTDLTERAFEDVMDHYQAIAREQQEEERRRNLGPKPAPAGGAGRKQRVSRGKG